MHYVELHVTSGECVSLQLLDGQEQIVAGPTTITMVSQQPNPPVPIPVQVPPGHMIHQIADENGILKHIILSLMDNPQLESAVFNLPHGSFRFDSNGQLEHQSTGQTHYSQTSYNNNMVAGHNNSTYHSTTTTLDASAPYKTVAAQPPPPQPPPLLSHQQQQQQQQVLVSPPAAIAQQYAPNGYPPALYPAENSNHHNHHHHHHRQQQKPSPTMASIISTASNREQLPPQQAPNQTGSQRPNSNNQGQAAANYGGDGSGQAHHHNAYNAAAAAAAAAPQPRGATTNFNSGSGSNEINKRKAIINNNVASSGGDKNAARSYSNPSGRQTATTTPALSSVNSNINNATVRGGGSVSPLRLNHSKGGSSPSSHHHGIQHQQSHAHYQSSNGLRSSNHQQQQQTGYQGNGMAATIVQQQQVGKERNLIPNNNQATTNYHQGTTSNNFKIPPPQLPPQPPPKSNNNHNHHHHNQHHQNNAQQLEQEHRAQVIATESKAQHQNVSVASGNNQHHSHKDNQPWQPAPTGHNKSGHSSKSSSSLVGELNNSSSLSPGVRLRFDNSPGRKSQSGRLSGSLDASKPTNIGQKQQLTTAAAMAPARDGGGQHNERTKSPLSEITAATGSNQNGAAPRSSRGKQKKSQREAAAKLAAAAEVSEQQVVVGVSEQRSSAGSSRKSGQGGQVKPSKGVVEVESSELKKSGSDQRKRSTSSKQARAPSTEVHDSSTATKTTDQQASTVSQETPIAALADGKERSSERVKLVLSVGLNPAQRSIDTASSSPPPSPSARASAPVAPTEEVEKRDEPEGSSTSEPVPTVTVPSTTSQALGKQQPEVLQSCSRANESKKGESPARKKSKSSANCSGEKRALHELQPSQSAVDDVDVVDSNGEVIERATDGTSEESERGSPLDVEEDGNDREEVEEKVQVSSKRQVHRHQSTGFMRTSLSEGSIQSMDSVGSRLTRLQQTSTRDGGGGDSLDLKRQHLEATQTSNGTKKRGGEHAAAGASKGKSAAQRSGKLSSVAQVRLLNLQCASIGSSSVCLRWSYIPTLADKYNIPHHHHHKSPALMDHFVVEQASQKNGDTNVLIAPKIVYQGCAMTCRINHLSTDKIYHFKVRRTALVSANALEAQLAVSEILSVTLPSVQQQHTSTTPTNSNNTSNSKKQVSTRGGANHSGGGGGGQLLNSGGGGGGDHQQHVTNSTNRSNSSSQSNTNHSDSTKSSNHHHHHHNHHHPPVKFSNLARQFRNRFLNSIGKLVQRSLSSYSDTKFAGLLLVLFTIFAMLLAIFIHFYIVAPVTE